MPLDLTQHPDANLFVQEGLRPLAERFRNILYASQANIGRLQSLMAILAAHPNQSDLVDDGRTAEGVQPMTVAQLLTTCNFIVELLTWSQTPPNLDNGTTALRLCVRPFRVE
jgi:hypothetical protein